MIFDSVYKKLRVFKKKLIKMGPSLIAARIAAANTQRASAQRSLSTIASRAASRANPNPISLGSNRINTK